MDSENDGVQNIEYPITPLCININYLQLVQRGCRLLDFLNKIL